MGDLQPYLTVKCITHRKNPLWTGPAQTPLFAGLIYKRLRYDLNMPHVLAVDFPHNRIPASEGHSGGRITAIKIKANTKQDDVWRTLEAAKVGEE